MVHALLGSSIHNVTASGLPVGGRGGVEAVTAALAPLYSSVVVLALQPGDRHMIGLSPSRNTTAVGVFAAAANRRHCPLRFFGSGRQAHS